MNVQLGFSEFLLEDGYLTQCDTDRVKIYEGGSPVLESKLIATLCGDKGLQKTYLAPGKMTVVFKSDDTIQAKGFKATYKEGKPISINGFIVQSYIELHQLFLFFTPRFFSCLIYRYIRGKR